MKDWLFETALIVSRAYHFEFIVWLELVRLESLLDLMNSFSEIFKLVLGVFQEIQFLLSLHRQSFQIFVNGILDP